MTCKKCKPIIKPSATSPLVAEWPMEVELCAVHAMAQELYEALPAEERQALLSLRELLAKYEEASK